MKKKELRYEWQKKVYIRVRRVLGSPQTQTGNLETERRVEDAFDHVYLFNSLHPAYITFSLRSLQLILTFRTSERMAAYPSKSASQWRHADELTTLSITPTPYPALFGPALPLLPAYVPAAIINNQDMPAPQTGHNDDTLDFFNNLKAYCNERTHESRIDDLSATILRISHCSTRRPHFRRFDLPLRMSNTRRWANPNFVLFSNDGYIKAVGEHKKKANVEAQWAAEAIAAAQYNNNLRSVRNLPLIDHTIMGLIMVSARPRFYRMLVTVALGNAVALGNIPPTATTLQFYDPPVSIFGFETAHNRAFLFRCYEAWRLLL